MEKMIFMVMGLLILAGCTRPFSKEKDATPEELAKGILLQEIEHATAIAWIGPHCDDEIVVSGLLALSGLHYKKDTYAVSFNQGAVGFPPGATLEDRYSDNEDFERFLGLKAYVRLGLDGYKGENKKQQLFELLDGFVAETGVDLFVTFENTHGGNGHGGHIEGSQWVTEYCKKRGITLYYIINRDPVWGGKMDPLPYTDEIDLDSFSVITSEGERSLWEVKVMVLEIYSSSVPAALRIVNSSEALEKMVHREYYRKVP